MVLVAVIGMIPMRPGPGRWCGAADRQWIGVTGVWSEVTSSEFCLFVVVFGLLCCVICDCDCVVDCAEFSFCLFDLNLTLNNVI